MYIYICTHIRIYVLEHVYMHIPNRKCIHIDVCLSANIYVRIYVLDMNVYVHKLLCYKCWRVDTLIQPLAALPVHL